MVVEIVSVANGEEKLIIYIDAGHGGSDGGAIGYDGTYEKDLVLIISKKLERILSINGFTVIMTRTDDYDIAPIDSRNRKVDDIHERVRRIKNSNAYLYLSIHANSYPSRFVWGAQTFFNKNNNESRDLANFIQDSFIINLLNTHRVAKTISGIYLVDKVSVTGCLIEVGFLSNIEELSNLKRGSYQDKIVNAIYLGLCDYLQKNSKIN
jgi:N-acetylmuramoyl-L-alanine amidase